MSQRTHRPGLVGMVIASGGAVGLRALGAIQPIDFGIELQQVAAGGMVAPNLVTHAGDGSGRLFIVDQIGKIRIVQNGQLLPTPFLDLTATIPTLNTTFDERGVLGIAFHPNYAENGRFWVRYSVPRAGQTGEPCLAGTRGCHSEVLSEFHVSASDPNVANPTPVATLLTVPKPQFNHNSGDVAFGPDGFLYFTLGDGGGANDGLADNPPSHGPGGNGQNLNAYLGKIHRVSVNNTGGLPYVVPPTNPFFGQANVKEEIFAYGLRNPYRFSWDTGPGGDGRLWLADVGQNLTEEIDIITPGGNYGWVIREGSHCFDPLNPNTYPPDSFCSAQSAGLINPVSEYQHTENGVVVGISIIGGFVYRGSQFPALGGKYVFGDYSTSFNIADGHLFYVNAASPAQVWRPRLGRAHRPMGLYVKGMGRDQAGEVYVCTGSARGPSGTDGTIWKIVPAGCPADLDNGSGTGTPDGGVTIDDLLYFIAQFTDGTTRADVDDGSGTGSPDGGVTIDDLLYYLTHFQAGC